VVDRAIALQEQGYTYTGVLATSYNDKSQILAALGRFREALLFDEKAMAEIQRCAHAGDGISQEELPIYSVNRGRLYLRLGRIDEAENILQEALPHISAQRRKYRMFAQEALEEIKQWRQQAVAPEHQLDWRWVERLRRLMAYSSTWWLTWAGPFTPEEQQTWNRLFTFPLDEDAKTPLGVLMKVSRERELEAAIAQQREPRLQYPAIPLEEVRYEINGLLQLYEDVGQQEPNVIVRRLYQGAIEEELDYLRLLEATSEGNTERFWECNLRIFPLPTVDEMNYALAPLTSLLQRGKSLSELAPVSQQVEDMLRTRFHLSFDLGQDETGNQEKLSALAENATDTEAEPEWKISAQTAKRFFEAVLQGSGYDQWRVVIDPNATGARVSQGGRQMILPEKQFTLPEIQHLFSHELAGHTARFMAGEHSLLGLLGIHTRNYLPTEEGLALYHQRQEELQHGRLFNDEGLRWMTLAVGLASGVMTPPQTFLQLFTFFEALTFLHSRLNLPKREVQKAQEYARTYALSLCLRIYRGVPDLNRAGVCFLLDGIYLHGLRLIEQAVAQDETIPERLAVGACALEDLPDLQELGIVAPPPSYRKLTTASDLEAYILSFDDTPQESGDEQG
jgi:tetratricopeptide (TPR) repeat protein